MKVSFKGNKISRLVLPDHDSSIRPDKLLMLSRRKGKWPKRRTSIVFARLSLTD